MTSPCVVSFILCWLLSSFVTHTSIRLEGSVFEKKSSKYSIEGRGDVCVISGDNSQSFNVAVSLCSSFDAQACIWKGCIVKHKIAVYISLLCIFDLFKTLCASLNSYLYDEQSALSLGK